MLKEIFGSVALTIVFTASANAAHYVELQTDSDIVSPGDTFTITIVGDFQSLGLLAGGVQILYDAAHMQIDDFAFNLNVDTDLSCPGAGLCPVDPPGTLSIVWGQFLSDLIAPDAGPTVMGTITVSALDIAPTEVLVADFSTFTGGWFGAGFVSIDPPELRGLTFSAIPLPAGVWLMIGGLGVLARFRRK